MHLARRAFCAFVICARAFSVGWAPPKHTGALRHVMPQRDKESELQVPCCLWQEALDTGEVKTEDLTSSTDTAFPSCTFICGPVLVFSITSKGTMKPATEFLLISSSSPALSLMSCIGRCQEQGYARLMLVWSSLTLYGGSLLPKELRPLPLLLCWKSSLVSVVTLESWKDLRFGVCFFFFNVNLTLQKLMGANGPRE